MGRNISNALNYLLFYLGSSKSARDKCAASAWLELQYYSYITIGFEHLRIKKAYAIMTIPPWAATAVLPDFANAAPMTTPSGKLCSAMAAAITSPAISRFLWG